MRGLRPRSPSASKTGFGHDSNILCDALVSLPKSMLTDFIGTLSPRQMRDLNEALRVALGLEEDPDSILDR